MKQRSRVFDAFLSTALLVGLAVLAYTMRYGPLPFTQQMRNLEAARKHIPILQPLLDQDPRFTKLKAGTWTGENGCMSVHGIITSKLDFSDLKKLVSSSKLPVGVLYVLELLDGDRLSEWRPVQ